EKHDAGELVRKRYRAERETVVDIHELKPEGASDHKAHVLAALPPGLQKPAELDRVAALALPVEQRHERSLWNSAPHLLVLSQLHQLEPFMPRPQLLIMLHIVGKWGAQSSDGNDDDTHDGILGPWTTPTGQSATSISTSRRTSWRGSTRTSRTSATPITSSPR